MLCCTPHSQTKKDKKKIKKIKKARKIIDLLREKAYFVSVKREGPSWQGGRLAHNASNKWGGLAPPLRKLFIYTAIARAWIGMACDKPNCR